MYNAVKKSYTVECQEKILLPEVWGKNISFPSQITHTLLPPHPEKSNGRPLKNKCVVIKEIMGATG